MACKTSFELYHNFPKLAEESGFTFNTHRPRVHIEWNKIRLINIDSLIRERKFNLIEQHVNDILDCALESEFDVRILDEGVLKIFRLAQLAVEYQQFCRHYLDRSVYVLREEVTALAQELESTKRLLKDKEEEIRKLRKRSKSSFRTSLPYGNENIASLILKTLSNKNDIFPTLSSTETMHHNKCTYCDKVFLNQLYLQSHISRRHANLTEIPQKDIDQNELDAGRDGNDKLNNEITELRSKLSDMEKLITNLGKSNNNENAVTSKTNCEPTISTEMKDAEVSTNSEAYILDKIEEWKKEEQDKYNKEINLLRTQIITLLDSFKEKEKETAIKNELNVMNELHATINQQGLEISALKQELINTKSSADVEEIAKKKEIEAQLSYWVKQAELQSTDYKLLLQKLEVAVKDAEKSRAEVEAERARVLQLQNLLRAKQESLINDVKHNHDMAEPGKKEVTTKEATVVKTNHKENSIRNGVSIQKLQQKAQELLNIENTSTSDDSTSSNAKVDKIEKDKTFKGKEKRDVNHKFSLLHHEHHNKRKSKKRMAEIRGPKSGQLEKGNNNIRFKENLNLTKKNGLVLPGSPMKIIRAKITEEVNNRLVELGVDPLKSRLPENVFGRQKRQLQELQQVKFKKQPGREEVFHSIRTRLDSNTTTLKTAQTNIHHSSPPKTNKPFSFSSVISNVKTKALSLVKTNDYSRNDHSAYDSVAKKAMMLLKTPSTSTNSSPKSQGQINSSEKFKDSHNPNETGIKPKTKSRNKSDHTRKIDSESTTSDNNDNEYYTNRHNVAAATIENVIKSPTLYPLDIVSNVITTREKNNIVPTKSNSLLNIKNNTIEQRATNGNSSDDVDSSIDHAPIRTLSEENIARQTKGVLKNASSMSSLNKKKVIFDMDAIQIKSVSVSSPSQSINEKNDKKDKYGLGLINLDNEEWDISSIDNEPIQKNPVLTRASPKIAELRETIESQLSRRNNSMSTAVFGGVDILAGPSLTKVPVSSKGGTGGSNTSLGSSILDDTDSTPTQNQVALVKSKTLIDKDDSEIDISEFVTDELVIKNTVKT